MDVAVPLANWQLLLMVDGIENIWLSGVFKALIDKLGATD
jgi:hypothetical protein